ncbi:MAG: DUF4339 domain-containing protein [Prosthecobacter sp.]|uniref:DUF4339 domain-containing protein n=1 Tax=Prosthecobacter sp. TaxID=1965333 RepID=UPI003BAEE67A
MDALHTFHVWQNSQSQGPFTARVMQDMLKQGTLSRQALIRYRDGEDWVPLSTYADVIDPPKMQVVEAPSAPMETRAAVDMPLTVNVVVDWLLRAALFFMLIGIGMALLGMAAFGMPGLYACVGPLTLALTTAIIAWSRP